MLITVIVDSSFNHPMVRDKQFIIEIDPNETVENLKVLYIIDLFYHKVMITLKFADLDLE